MNVNIPALKQCDNLKWDFQDVYPKATRLFAMSGDVTDEARALGQEIINQAQTIKAEADAIAEAAQLTING